MKHIAHTLFPFVGALALAAGVSACSGFDHEEADEPDLKVPTEVKMKMPASLEDCKTFRVHGEGGIVVLVTRCPHSETTTETGKVRVTVAEEVDEDAAREDAIAEMSVAIEAAKTEAK